MDLRGEAGAEREDLKKSGCRFHGRSANSSLPERGSLQRCVWFMEIFDPRTSGIVSTRQGSQNFRKWAQVGNRRAERVTAASRVAMPRPDHFAV
jgi:hypothetical protein